MELARSGMINKWNIRKGKVIWARYSLTPHVVFSESNAGGIAGALGALIPIPSASAVIGSLRFKEAQVVIFLTDNETTEQIAAAGGQDQLTLV